MHYKRVVSTLSRPPLSFCRDVITILPNIRNNLPKIPERCYLSIQHDRTIIMNFSPWAYEILDGIGKREGITLYLQHVYVTWDLVRSEIRLEEGFINNSPCLRTPGPSCISPVRPLLTASPAVQPVFLILVDQAIVKLSGTLELCTLSLERRAERWIPSTGVGGETRLSPKTPPSSIMSKASSWRDDEKYASITSTSETRQARTIFAIRVPAQP